MARYGKSAEDFNRESAALEAARKARQGVAAAEGELTGALDTSSSALDRATAKTRLYNKAKQEQSSFEARQAQANVKEAESVDLNTAAIERNAKARERAALANRNLGGAFAGARDPLFARASGMADPTTGVSQYELRRQLQIGQARAARLQQAVGLGIQPGGPGVAHGPATAAQDADIQYAAAMRARREALKKGDQAALIAADADLAEAKARRSQLESITKNQTATSANTAAIEKDAAARERIARDPGQALIRHPELYGRQAYAPQDREQSRTRPVVGELPVRYGGGNEAYDSKVEENTRATQRLTQARLANASAASRELQGHVDEIFDRQAVAADRAARATHNSSVELGTASQQMTRHGALTSEFITAAARGETTLREMGNQALITAGKFSAWTGAASAIYGAVAAVHELGKGAIDSSSGVNQLRRVVNDVNPDTAQKSFRDLAGQFNVPVSDASDAVYRMGQVFHTQAEAVTAAKAALYSYKTGEVDVASSTQNLIAITRGFGLSSNDLLSVYDQINQAQNTFGIRIKDTEEGLAKAGGTFRNSGGDLNYLLGLFVAIQKATGRSGTEIGTGIARAANQIRKPSSQAALRALGVDVDPNNLQDTIQSALKASRKPGSDYNAIAAGLFGNQYARLIAPVLRDQSTLNKALKETSPEASKNSAQKELAKTLGQVDEQLHKVGISLQRLGGALAQAGAFDVFGMLLKLLNGTLDVAVHIVDTFDKLPQPLRDALSIMGELYVMMALIRKVAPGAPLIGSPEAKQARLIQAGQASAVQASIDEREGIARQARRAQGVAERGRQNLGQLRTDYEAARVAGTLPAEGTEERNALNRRIIATEESVLRAEARAVELELEANAAREQVVVAEKEQARYKALQAEQGAKGVVAEAARQGIYRPGEFGLTSTGAVPVEEGAGAAARDVSRLERGAGAVTGQMRALSESAALSGRAGALPRAVISKTAAGLEKGAATLSGWRGGLASLKSGAAKLAASLGPLDYAIIGLIAYTELKSKVDAFMGDMHKATTTLESAPTSQAAYDAQSKVKAADPSSFGVHAATWFENFGGLETLQGKESPIEEAQYQQQLKKLNDAERARRDRLMAEARAQGPDHPVPLQFLGAITKQIDGDSKLRNEGLISLREFDKRMKKHAIEIETAFNADPAGLKRARDQLAAAKRQAASGGTDYKAMFGGATPQELQADLAANSAIVGQVGGATPRNMARLRANYDYLRRALQFSKDPKEIQALLQARASFFKSIEDSVNQTLQLQLGDAHTPAARAAAYRQASAGMKGLTRESSHALKRDLDAQSKAQDEVAKDRQGLRAIDNVFGPLGNTVAGVTGLRAKLRKDTADLKRLQRGVKKDGEEMAAAYAEEKAQQQKIRDDSFQSRQSARQTELAYKQSETTDKATQDAEAIRSAAAQVRDATRTYGRGSDEWKQAMTELNNARHQNATDIQADVQSEIESQNALITARASGDPTGRSEAIAAVTTAQRSLAGVLKDKSLKGKARQAAINNANAAIITAQLALQNYYREQANALAAARFTLRESRHDDPIKRAQIELEAARDAIKRATTPQERIQAQADYNDKRRALRDTRLQQSEDNIQWELDMGKIERDQAIREYQALLRHHNLTKAQRRELQLKIKQLQDAANADAQSFDLAVGAGIKLPTVYDVRRAIGSIRQAANQGARMTANNRIEVNVEVNDPHAAGKVYEALDQAMGTTIQSNMRQAGLSL